MDLLGAELAAEFELEAGDLGESFAESSIGEDIQVTPDGVIDDCIARVKRVEGVVGMAILNRRGEIVRTSFDQMETTRRGLPLLELHRRAQELLEPGTELQMIRLRTRKEEVVVTCGEEHTLIVVQKPHAG